MVAFRKQHGGDLLVSIVVGKLNYAQLFAKRFCVAVDIWYNIIINLLIFTRS